MNEKDVFKELNGINYREEEIDEYSDFIKNNNKNISKITNDIKTKLAKEKLNEAIIYVEKDILENDEVIEKVFKATDIDIIKAATAVNVVMSVPFMSGDGYTFNRLFFCTNKRIIIVSANYYNRVQGVKIYNREDIKQIDMGKDIKKKYRFKIILDLKRNKAKKIKAAVLPFIFEIFCAYLISSVFSRVAYMISTKSNLIATIVFIVSILGFSYFFTTRRSLDTELLIELNDGNLYDLLIRNEDYKEVQEYISNINF